MTTQQFDAPAPGARAVVRPSSDASPRLKAFFRTPAMPCPYIGDQIERHVLTDLAGATAQRQHDILATAGFRRSHGIIYRPACPSCQACVPVRVVAEQFRPSRTQRRVMAANRSLQVAAQPPKATPEQYRLFKRYQCERHEGGEMARMDFGDYCAMIEDTPVETFVFEFRDADGRLVAACLTDGLADGLSAVYSYFDPALIRHSLGSFMILWLIEEARRRGLGFVYLGFWIAQSRKMSYKVGFRPLELFADGRWHRHNPFA